MSVHILVPCNCNSVYKEFSSYNSELILQSFTGTCFWSLMGHVIGLEIKAATLLIALLSVPTWAAGHTIFPCFTQFPPELFYLTGMHSRIESKRNVKSVSLK